MKLRKPRELGQGERELHLAIVELELVAFRDLVTALAARYPTQEELGTGFAEAALRHLLAALRLIESRCLRVRRRSHAGR